MSETADLPSDHYRLHVVPALPPPGVLFQRFKSPDVLFRPDQEWQTPEAWREASLTPGERIFFVKRFDRAMYRLQVLAWVAESAYRPATHLEAIAFASAYPDRVLVYAMDEGWIMAYGSTACDDGHPHAACLEALGKHIRLGAEESRDRSFPLVQKGCYLLVKR